MKRTELDENSFNANNENTKYSGLTPEQEEYVLRMKELGFDYMPMYENGTLIGWSWIRREEKENKQEFEYNYMTKDDLIAMQLEAFKKYYAQVQPAPGSSSGNGMSEAGYNMYAKWDLWRGGYVDRVGYVAPPTSSMYYGLPLLHNNSWGEQGLSGSPIPEARYYKIDFDNKWHGGHVEGWGYVDKDTHVLGASTSIRFTGPMAYYDGPLVNIVNLSIEISAAPLDINAVRGEFMKYWNEDTLTYDIDNITLRDYLDKHFYAAYARSIPEALEKHYGVMLRVVDRIEEVNAKTLMYGKDFLILGYNPVLQQYVVIDPNGRLGTLDALKINKGEIKTISYIYYSKDR